MAPRITTNQAQRFHAECDESGSCFAHSDALYTIGIIQHITPITQLTKLSIASQGRPRNLEKFKTLLS